MRRTWIALVVLLAGPLMMPASSRQQAATAKAVLLEARGVPGESRPVPLHLTMGKGVEIGALSLAVRFPPKQVTFQRVELGGIAAGSGVTAKADVKEGKEGTVVQVVVDAPERDGARTPLLDGPLATLWFQIAEAAEPKTIVPLEFVSAAATGAKPGSGPVKLETQDGQIVVSAPLITACFFYMH